MTSTPAEELAETLVELAAAMAEECDLDGFLRLLVNRSVHVLDVPAAGVFIVDHGVIASHESLLPVLGYDESPLLDCCRDGRAVAVPQFTAGSRWQAFTDGARRAGFASVHVLPLRRHAETVGALALFRDTEGTADARIAQAVADIAALCILQARALRRSEELAGQLQHALDSRVVIEQAKGVLAERLGLEMSAAFTALRNYARSHNARVAELASSIVDGKFDTNLLRS
ncbi:GAF and ANTAR domain-containing protein [Actinophytocola algeriensis]|uniref:GAF domain-containing protein n=1 Tax=Actinophytocola algeriensis TaxID=1768010 RepID=A0A7W7PZJ3_9PSEU|nr:GAF and ANTAR domain-containing protein [Actinophytocola algeriensis]MBB4904061.1 GAF domain-containing protein [Actinophytocola algeriensis]MBE1477082.1 GAF domain-containing protein [Actinophytocola algeriensis]